tara:strand:+ start:14071 stop:14463 length:393 start_codon:yes stop_codon:yes gene_type:complete
MAKISADIAKVVDITARRNDSFYLKVTLTNEDGTIYDVIDSNGASYEAHLKVYNNDELVLGFTSVTSGDNSPIINSTITVSGSDASLTIATTANNMGLYSGSYKYKMYVSSSTDNETNTVIVGKFKVIDI